MGNHPHHFSKGADMSEITKAFEGERPVRQKAKSQIYFRTGSVLIDELVGGGMSLGYPSGRIANIYGESGAGKTFFEIRRNK